MYAELAKKRQELSFLYDYLYETQRYGMSDRRRRVAKELIFECYSELPANPKMLDVGAGRGEMVKFAKLVGFNAIGIDSARSLQSSDVRYGEAHFLRFASYTFDLVTCFDVIEHVIEEDVAPALYELARVASSVVILSAASHPSIVENHAGDQVNLHISARPLKQWMELFKSVFHGWTVEHVKQDADVTHYFRIYREE